MTCRIGNELNTATHGALSFNLPVPRTLAVLDLCLAPGGFTTATLTHNPRVSVHGITLPLALGGYEVRIPRWQTDTRIAAIRFLDITMLAGEMGVTVDGDGDDAALVPATHPDAGRFLFERPFAGEQFDLVFCGGTVVRNHARAAYRCRTGCESVRLLTSQLVLGLGRLRPGGTLVLVMHRADAWDSVGLLRLFAGFADVVLFKLARAHARKSSFYMVARNVQSGGPRRGRLLRGGRGGGGRRRLGMVVWRERGWMKDRRRFLLLMDLGVSRRVFWQSSGSSSFDWPGRCSRSRPRRCAPRRGLRQARGLCKVLSEGSF